MKFQKVEKLLYNSQFSNLIKIHCALLDLSPVEQLTNIRGLVRELVFANSCSDLGKKQLRGSAYIARKGWKCNSVVRRESSASSRHR
jgi:hypothetical protein